MKRYADDEQRLGDYKWCGLLWPQPRSTAKQIRPALRVAAAGRRLRRRSSSAYRCGYAVVVAPRIRRPGARNAAHARFSNQLYVLA